MQLIAFLLRLRLGHGHIAELGDEPFQDPAANLRVRDLAAAEENPFVQQVAEYVRTHHDAAYVPISAKIESELIDLTPEEIRLRLFAWRPSDRSERIDTLEPTFSVELS